MTADARSRATTPRRLPALATTLVLLTTVLWPTAAAASDTGTWTDLRDALATCGGTIDAPTTATLTSDILQTDGALTVACDAVIDLNGHDLTIANVVIEPGSQFTIVDGSTGGGTLTADASALSQVAGIRTTGAALVVRGGTVTATGGWHSAGIGGSLGGAGGSVTITGGTVTAYSMCHGAGIGGGQGAAGGPVEISGGTVTATGTCHAAGIGGGYQGAGGPVTISGGTVRAIGVGQAAGIGGSLGGAGGDVQIGAGAVVTAEGGQTAVGSGSESAPFGSLAVAGTLRVPTGHMRIPSGVVVSVSPNGSILGGVGDPTTGANFSGGGRLANEGVVALDASHVTAAGVTVSGNHYRVAFETDGGSPVPDEVTVFASSFAAGHRNLPAAPGRDGLAFLGWTSEPDGAGDPVTATTVLPGTSNDGVAAGVTAHAHWDVLTLESGLVDDAATITAGGAATFTPSVLDGDGRSVANDPADWTIGDADGRVDATIDLETGRITVTSTTAGTHLLELRVPVSSGSTVTTTVTLHVEAAAPSVLLLEAAGTTVAQGTQATITVSGTDAHGNPTGDVTDEVTFTSDVATDVIEGNTVTFPTASPHTITATHTSGAVATLVFTVIPAASVADPADPADSAGVPDPPTDLDPVSIHPSSAAPVASLPATGTNPLGMLLAALLSVLTGSLLLHRDADRQR